LREKTLNKQGELAGTRVAARRKMNYRTIWISDLHLGTRHAQVGKLLEFLRDTECEHLYIVGDFIDGWQLRRKWFWTEEYNVLVQKLLRKNRKQTRVTVITGNHDEFLEHFLGFNFGAVRLLERAVHRAADGKRYLVIHGHQFDGLAHFNRLLDRVGSALYERILDLNVWINRCRRMLGIGYWSFASYIKLKAKAAAKYVNDYEDALIQYARKSEVQGVICGHIHRPEIRQVGDIVYMNCGDWVENCTALVEEYSGEIRLVRFQGHGGEEGKELNGVGNSKLEIRNSKQAPNPKFEKPEAAIATLYTREAS
jgi:UDP-2,3-diacylglucosamine pyrophosphatase LpxH